MVAIHITGVHYRVSDKVRDYITDKLGSLKKFHPRLSSLHVTIHEAEKHGFRVDVDMHLPSGKDVVAHVNGETIYAAVDGAAARCAAQLRKIHDRMSEPQRLRA
jgi:ribosomal subunit interface protein